MTHDYKRHGTTTLYDVASIVEHFRRIVRSARVRQLKRWTG